MAKGFLRNSGTDSHREVIRPLGSNSFSREVRMIAKKRNVAALPPPPSKHTHADRIFSILACPRWTLVQQYFADGDSHVIM